MEWITPKYDWEMTDWFDVSDYNRIRNNLLYINEMLNHDFPDVAVTLDLGEPKTYGDDYFPSEFNRFEEAILSFSRIGKDMNFGERGYYDGNSPFIMYDQLNRIEKCAYRYKNYNTPLTSIVINESKRVYNIYTYRDYLPETVQLTASVTPVDLSCGVEWSSSDTDVVTVSEDGLVTRVGQGTAIITAKAIGSELTDTRTFNVFFGLETAHITPSYLEMEYLDERQLSIEYEPSFATFSVTWTSSDPTICSVDSSGKVTALGDGTATITATITQEGFERVFTDSIQAGIIVAVESVTISPDTNPYQFKTRTSYSPETLQLSAVISPATAGNKRVTWSSSNTNVVKVDATGLVTRVGFGSATITCTTESGNKTATKDFSVAYGIDNISLSESTLIIQENGTRKTILLNRNPEFATLATVTWASSDTSKVRIVSSDSTSCTIESVSSGTANITVTVTNDSAVGGNVMTASCAVTVNVAVSGVTISPSTNPYVIWTKTTSSAETVQLTANVLPADASNKNVTLSSSDTSVVTVSNTGLVTRVGNGSATITCTTQSGNKTATKEFQVKYAVNSISLNRSTLTLYEEGSQGTLALTINPAYATPDSVVWSSSDSSIVKIASSDNSQCVVEVVSGGVATITVTVTNNSAVGGNVLTKTCTVTASVSVTGVTILPTTNPYVIWTRTSYTPETVQLTADVHPSTASNKNVTWSSGATSVVKVSSTGLVTRVGKGNAVVTCKTSSGSKTDTKQFTVNYGVDSISIGSDFELRNIGTQKTLSLTKTPTYGIPDSVVWTTSNASKVKIVSYTDTSCVVEAVAGGTATITCRVTNNSAVGGDVVTATSVASVTEAIAGVSISPATDPYTIWDLESASPLASVDFTGIVTPEYAYNKNVTWKSSNTSVFTVASTGDTTCKVTRAGTAGTATLTCTSAGNTSIKATKTINVKFGVTSISLDPIYILTEGGTAQAVLTVNPSSAEYQVVSWTSSNTSICTVDSNGLVTQHSMGDCTITVKVKDTHYNTTFTATATCKAYKAATSITTGNLPTSETMWYEDRTYNCYFNYTPADATLLNFEVDEYQTSPRSIRVWDVVDDHNGKISFKAEVVRTYYITRIACTIDDGRLYKQSGKISTRPAQ